MSQVFCEELALILRTGWRVITVETFEEKRAVQLISHIAKKSETPVIQWSSASGLSTGGKGAGTLDEGLRAIAAVSEPTLFVLLDAHVGLRDPGAVRRLRDLISVLETRRQAVLLLGPVVDVPIELAREVGRLQLPLPRAEDIGKILRGAVKGLEGADLEPAVRAALGLTGAEALRVFRKACTVAGGLNDKAVSHIIEEKRQLLRRTPALSFHEAGSGLGEVGGLGELKHWLRERQRAFSDEAQSFGLPTPKGLLLLGVQGCGKSLCAKSIAREWQFPLLRLDMAAAFGSTDQSPELTIREAIAVAESVAPAVLWIDEIEKGFAASDSDPSASRVFGAFLTWLAEKQSPVFVTATANDIGGLPPELLRRGRFDDLFFIDLPNHAERAEILAIHLRKHGRDPLHFPVDELALAAERLSGAELEQVVASALYTAFGEKRDLNDNDLANAINDTVPLYDTYEDRIKELRDWARTRARPATVDGKMVDLFSQQLQEDEGADVDTTPSLDDIDLLTEIEPL
jgi:ATP-dependent 26S proteasome regulatory subunit